MVTLISRDGDYGYLWSGNSSKRGYFLSTRYMAPRNAGRPIDQLVSIEDRLTALERVEREDIRELREDIRDLRALVLQLTRD